MGAPDIKYPDCSGTLAACYHQSRSPSCLLSARDYPAIQGTTFLFAVMDIATNLLVDVSYAFLDPRIRYN